MWKRFIGVCGAAMVIIGSVVAWFSTANVSVDSSTQTKTAKTSSPSSMNASSVTAAERWSREFEVDVATPTPSPTPAPRDTATQRPARDTQKRRTAQGTQTIRSTAYCLRGTTASGAPAGDGVVASTVLPRYSKWRILSGPLAGKVVTVLDTGGPKATFDIWVSSCEWARQSYGVKHIQIERVD